MPELPAHPKAQVASRVISTLQEAGYRAYLAGGSVRDILLGKLPKDYDVVTSATPDEVEQLFPRTVPIGKQFGIILVLLQRHQFEIATFRQEGGYSDSRRPDDVFWSSAKEDAKRRDFTINALFLDPVTGQVMDYVDGVRDLQAGLIRFVGNPLERLAEDHLRILRAVRFKNTLGFQYDRSTYEALKQSAPLIADVSPERIRQELDAMFSGAGRLESLRELDQLGILKVILPEIDALHGLPQPLEYHHEGDVFEHSLLSVAALPKQVPAFLVWATLLHDVGKIRTLHYPTNPQDRIRFDGHRTAGAELARQIGRRLHMSRTETETIAWIIEHHMNLKGIDTLREAKRREYLLDPRFKWLLEVHKADASGTLPKNLSLYREVKGFYKKYLDLWKSEQLQGRPRPLVTGHDLQQLGVKPGKHLGSILKKLEIAQLERRVDNKKEALALAKTLINQ